VHGLKFFPGPDIQQTQRRILLAPGDQFRRGNEELGVLLVAGLQVREHLVHLQATIALAERGQRFLGLKRATAAAADVIAAE